MPPQSRASKDGQGQQTENGRGMVCTARRSVQRVTQLASNLQIGAQPRRYQDTRYPVLCQRHTPTAPHSFPALAWSRYLVGSCDVSPQIPGAGQGPQIPTAQLLHARPAHGQISTAVCMYVHTYTVHTTRPDGYPCPRLRRPVAGTQPRLQEYVPVCVGPKFPSNLSRLVDPCRAWGVVVTKKYHTPCACCGKPPAHPPPPWPKERRPVYLLTRELPPPSAMPFELSHHRRPSHREIYIFLPSPLRI
jgi:hypothetical protein